MTAEAPYLLRLTRVLEERAIAIEPVLDVVTAVGTSSVFLGIGTLSDRVQLLVPANLEAARRIAPDASFPERAMLLVDAAPQGVSAAAVIGGTVSLRGAIDEVGPEAQRAAWIDAILPLSSGAVRNRTRHFGVARGAVTLAFAPRSGEGEAVFQRNLATVAQTLGAPDWRPVYAEAGEGADVGITTECSAAGPAPRIALRFGATSWDRAIDLAKAMVDLDRARGAAVRMGTLAGVLETDALRGVEAVVDSAESDLVVWLQLRHDA